MSVTSGPTKSHSWLRVADNVCNTLMMSTTDSVYNRRCLQHTVCDVARHVLQNKNSKLNFCVMSHCHMLAVCCTTICVLVHKTELNLKCLVLVGVTNACLGGRGSAECSELTNAYGSLPEVCTLSGLGVWQTHICFDKLRFNLWSANNQFRSSSISSSDLHIIYQDLLDITN